MISNMQKNFRVGLWPYFHSFGGTDYHPTPKSPEQGLAVGENPCSESDLAGRETMAPWNPAHSHGKPGLPLEVRLCGGLIVLEMFFPNGVAKLSRHPLPSVDLEDAFLNPRWGLSGLQCEMVIFRALAENAVIVFWRH